MILTASELTTYAPNVTLTEPALTGAIALAQGQLEGIRGANRKLEATEYTKIYRINIDSQTFKISEFPLVSITSLRGRIGNVKTRFGRQTGLSDWIEIDSDEYISDRNGLVTINRSFLHSTASNFGSSFRGSSRVNYFTEVEATYTAGFDFSAGTTDSNAIAIKALLGQILDYQVNSSLNQGIISEKIDADYTVNYSSNSGGGRNRVGAGVGQVPDSMLELVHQYRIVSGVGMRG